MTDGETFDIEQGPWARAQSWVSPLNWMTEPAVAPAGDGQGPELYDTTLRDGEQAAGVLFSPEQKVEIASALDQLGVGAIEAGFPAVSDQDREGVEAVAGLGLRARVTCLSRARPADVELAAACGVQGVALEVPAGYPRLKYQFSWSPDEVVRRAVEAVEHAGACGLDVALFLIDSTRAELAVLERLVKECADTGALGRLVVVDTVGVALPAAMEYLVGRCREWFPDGVIEVHTHNDFGLGVANALASLRAGAGCIQATVGGLGQRAGNVALEEVALALECLMGYRTGLDLARLSGIADRVAELSGYATGANKAVTGRSIFQWEPGLPVDALRKHPLTVEPYLPSLVGRDHELVLGKMSGAASIDWALEELGVEEVPAEQRARLLAAVKALGIEVGGPVSREQFARLLDETVGTPQGDAR